jgi:hypothetical protein
VVHGVHPELLKKELERIAAREGQSVARICKAFILAGSDA